MEAFFAFLLAAFFAANIGASGTAAAMGESYGGGAIRSKRLALGLAAGCAFAGAVLGGGEVVKTISQGLVPPGVMGPQVVLVILAAASAILFWANLLGIPLSTSQVTVGAVAGAGLALRALFASRLAWLVLWWVLAPLACLVLVVGLRALMTRPVETWLREHRHGERARAGLRAFLVAAGCYQAFSAGMNNVANAVGPLVGAGFLSPDAGVVLGGAFLAVGALFLGGRPLETNGKQITRLTVLDGVLVAVVAASLVVLASLRGIPVPLSQFTTLGILGVAVARAGRTALKKRVVVRIFRVWVVSPLASLGVAFAGTLAVTASDGAAGGFLAVGLALLAALPLCIRRGRRDPAGAVPARAAGGPAPRRPQATPPQEN